MKPLYLAIILSLSSVNVSAEMYKWVDEEGNVQYAQTPPPGSTPSTTVTPPSINSMSGAISGKEAPAEKSNVHPQLSESCEGMSKALNELTSRQNLAMPAEEKPGKFVVMSEETRQQRINLAKAYLQLYCKDTTVTEQRSPEVANREATSRVNTEADSCERSRRDLAVAESTPKLLVQDEAKPNKLLPLTQEARQQRITLLKAIVEFCKNNK